jgi:hypothetical protein
LNPVTGDPPKSFGFKKNKVVVLESDDKYMGAGGFTGTVAA